MGGLQDYHSVRVVLIKNWRMYKLIYSKCSFTETDFAIKPYTLTSTAVVVVVALLFYVHGKQLRSCRDGQLA